MEQRLLTFLLFILPLIVLPFGISPFETPKIFLGEVALIALIICFVSRYDFRETFQWKLLPFWLIILLCLLQLLIYPSFSILFGNAFRMQGAFLFILLSLFALTQTQLRFRPLPPKLVVGVLTLQLIATLFIQGKADNRAIGTLGEPNALAASVIFLFPFLFIHKDNARWVRILGSVLAVGIVFISGSRSGLVALVIEILFLLLTRYRLSLGVIVCSVVFGLSLSLPFLSRNQLYENRGEVWVTAIHAGLKHPGIGWGVGNMDQAFSSTIKEVQNNLRGYYVDSSHNLFLDWWVQGGIVGVSIIILVVILAGYHAFKFQQIHELTLLFGLVTALSFNPASIVSLIQLWWILGRIYSSQSHT